MASPDAYLIHLCGLWQAAQRELDGCEVDAAGAASDHNHAETDGILDRQLEIESAIGTHLPPKTADGAAVIANLTLEAARKWGHDGVPSVIYRLAWNALEFWCPVRREPWRLRHGSLRWRRAVGLALAKSAARRRLQGSAVQSARSTPLASPDAVLIHLCSLWHAMQRKLDAHETNLVVGTDDQDEADSYRILDRQLAIESAIGARLPPKTIEGATVIANLALEAARNWPDDCVPPVLHHLAWNALEFFCRVHNEPRQIGSKRLSQTRCPGPASPFASEKSGAPRGKFRL